jgi:hypothetical protein
LVERPVSVALPHGQDLQAVLERTLSRDGETYCFGRYRFHDAIVAPFSKSRYRCVGWVGCVDYFPNPNSKRSKAGAKLDRERRDFSDGHRPPLKVSEQRSCADICVPK